MRVIRAVVFVTVNEDDSEKARATAEYALLAIPEPLEPLIVEVTIDETEDVGETARDCESAD